MISLALLALAASASPQHQEAAPQLSGADLASWLFAAGSGGPGGNFDWCVPAGQVVILDTTSSILTGGPHCDSTIVQHVVGGVLEARNIWIGPGAVVRGIGPNPLVVFASGTVRIEGRIDVSGISSHGVTTLNTTNLPELGAAGQAGGGDGGVGNPNFTSASFKGGNGEGAFGVPNGGGGGGETGWNNIAAAQLDGRRGAGGGGGSLGANQAQTFGSTAQFGEWDQSFIGLDAEQGFENRDANAQGAYTGPAGPMGGRVGPRPFADADPSNDFYGYGIDAQTGAIVVGELAKPWAGAGGGGGGNASFVGNGGTFPPPFSPTGDEKGAGAGGGAGQLEILALGDIVFGSNGLIMCRGGLGGGGENTLFLNRVGGGSGGGSGGHVILQTAGVIDFTQSSGASTTAGELAGGILATGGQGGAGKGDKGGAISQPNGQTQTPPFFDACPEGYPLTGTNACVAHVDGAGGDGGPGIVQLHTLTGFDPTNPSILLPPGKSIGDVCKPLPVGADGSILLKPRFPGLPGDAAASAPANTETSRWERLLRVRLGLGQLLRMP
ncbi:MAG TPA: hypothetical protein VFE44_08425 [Thermoanaerobaculia bacterium]|nr:hypothetical protein [Thermoanaerobaculia bacterium]